MLEQNDKTTTNIAVSPHTISLVLETAKNSVVAHLMCDRKYKKIDTDIEELFAA